MRCAVVTGVQTCALPICYTGKRGAGQISAVSYNAPVGTLSWWQEHLIKRGVTVSEERERFGQKYLSFEHPDCGVGFRSEEHTSELQSLMRISYAVFCLKKKKKLYQHTTSNKDTTT